ncbi:MAG TPA: GNAT family N-acetyltransferase [Acidimicrobiia bacterium]|nr:GNAT family N-acetyltransferase [Acidimicrobiia bacterium]
MATRSVRDAARDTVRWRGGWARLGPWRGNPDLAHVVVGTAAPPTPEAVLDCIERLRAAGYAGVITNALGPRDAAVFADAGFEVRERLHLLERDQGVLPDADPTLPATRRARRSDRPAVLELDARAFPPFWQLEASGLDDALDATPTARFRVTADADTGVAGYAITGRAGRNGYLQRIAVDPTARRRGHARALVLDGLRWLDRHGVRRTLVNTQLDNDAAVALYESCGFRRLPAGLCVLGRSL